MDFSVSSSRIKVKLIYIGLYLVTLNTIYLSLS